MRAYTVIKRGKQITRYEYTAQEVYDKLVNQENICKYKGLIKFKLEDVSIVVKQKDVVGNIIQEWLQGWLEKRNIDFDLNPNTQMPPDFYLNKQNHHIELLEVKAFNSQNTPAFDIADFEGFAKAVLKEPWALYTNFLIFSYEVEADGHITIKKVWLKKLWEITRSSKNWALNIQCKHTILHKIRPCGVATWNALAIKTPRNKYPHFGNIEDFLSAFRDTLLHYPPTQKIAPTWDQNLNNALSNNGMNQIQIPWWHRIQNNYR